MNHRAIQRALFRMQLDPAFAARLRGREAGAVESTGLTFGELALLASADVAGVSADRDGKRRSQFLRNVTSEFALSLAAAGDAQLADEFTRSREFHEAVTADASLPLAFAKYLAGRLASSSALPRALAALETALARARRARRSAPALAPGEVALAPWAERVSVPAGTLEAAARVRSALDRGEPIAAGAAVSESEYETLLVRRAPEPRPFRLADVEVESLSPALDALLARAEKPLSAAERVAHARAAGISEAELTEIVAELLAERILIAG
jgi:hypothetical protein